MSSSRSAMRVYPDNTQLSSKTSSTWEAYTQCPHKKNGDKRIVMSYKPINSATIKPQWPVHSREGLNHETRYTHCMEELKGTYSGQR
ncbi:hypothetical protein GGS26DRAFT_542573 [Hypomontagnella submonticulosa]|nr:hypothetical protein GGS26DRAFT_542573 [Hypomontagnella submonticulosa]